MALRCGSVYFENDSAWIIPINLDALVEVERGGAGYVREVFLKFSQAERAELPYTALRGCREKLYISPIDGKKLYLYNLCKENFGEIRLVGEWRENEISDGIKFFASCTIGKEVYFVGKGYPGIVCVDTERECANIYNLDEQLVKESIGEYPGYFASHVAVVAEKLYIPICNGNKLYIFDTTDKKGMVRNLDKKYVSADFDGENVWMVPLQGGTVTAWNTVGKIVRNVECYPEGFMGGSGRYFNMGLYQNDHLWLFPFRSNMLIKINTITLRMECVKKWDNCEKIKYVNAGIIDRQRIWGLYLPERRLDIIDTVSGKVESRVIECPSNIDTYLEQIVYMQGKSFAYDEDLFTLRRFIEKLCMDTKYFSHIDSDKAYGNRIKDSIFGNR